MSGITLTLSLGHIKYLETQEMIYDILVNPSMLSWRRKLFSQLGTKKLVNLNEYEGDDRNPKVVLSEFLNRTSDDFYVASLHGGFEFEQGLIKRKDDKLSVFNLKDKFLKETAMKHWDGVRVINWLIEKNEKHYRKLITYKLERENEIGSFTKKDPEFRSLEKQIHELEAWQEAFADWFLDRGYELPKWGQEEGPLEMKSETPTEEKDETTNFIGETENTSAAKEPSLSEENDSNNFTRCDNGETWMITFQGKSASFKDAKGLRYLAILLNSPGKSFTPKMLITLDNEAPDFSAESTQDEAHQAGISEKDVDQGIPRFEKGELKRLRDDKKKLENDYREANEKENYARAEKIDEDIQALERLLTQGTNIRGQSRKIASEAEKQRISVYNAIKDQLRKFEKSIPGLNTHLDTKKTLKTGSALVYQPYPNVFWTVSF